MPSLRIRFLLLMAVALPSYAQNVDQDLSVRFIHRTPEIDYVFNAEDPTVEGWPETGQEVVWQAFIRNWFDHDLTGVAYEWQLDGEVVEQGTIDFDRDAEAVAEFAWNWTFERHELTFVLDPGNAIEEFSEANNELSVFTDAITIGYYVEQGLYDFFHEYQHKLGDGANSFDDWAQRGLRIFNQQLEDAVYPETPNGVHDRFRLDGITVVPDGELPLVESVVVGNATIGATPFFIPNGDDRTVDIQLGFEAELVDWPGYEDHQTAEWFNPFYYHGVAFHEMGHARYLIDVHGYGVDHNFDGNLILITEDGKLAVGTDYMPATRFGPPGPSAVYVAHRTEMQGLMNSTYGSIDRYSATALNLIAGRRAVAGNFNAPQNLGAFMNDLPQENRLTILGNEGTPLVGAIVSIYQSDPSGHQGGAYFKVFDDEPDLILVTDTEGAVLLGRNPFSDGPIVHGLGGSNAIAIVRVQHRGQVAYAFLESLYFNLNYWAGDVDLADYELSVSPVDPRTVATENPEELPSIVSIGGNYPNPFREATTIRFELSRPEAVSLVVTDVQGRQISRLLSDQVFPAGSHEIQWQAGEAPSGTYFYRLQTHSGVANGRMVRVR